MLEKNSFNVLIQKDRKYLRWKTYRASRHVATSSRSFSCLHHALPSGLLLLSRGPLRGVAMPSTRPVSKI